MRKYFLFGFLFISSTLTNAETITGSYTYNGKGVNDITVRSSSSQSKETTTNKHGYFKIKKTDPKKDTLFFSSYEGKAIIVPLESKSIVTIVRTDSTISVELSNPERRPSSVYGGVIFTQKELKNIGSNYVLDAINKKLPQRNLPTSFGYTSNEPLYFIDGVEVSSLQGITVEETAYVEVVRASDAAAASFGNRGANGAILVTTKTKYDSTKKE